MSSLCAASAGHTIYTVRISGVEVVAALFLRSRTGSLTGPDAHAAADQFRADFRNRYQILEVTPALVDAAMALAEKHNLRGYDAVQLAAALSINQVRASLSLSPVTFVCADNRLNTAAATENLQFENPNLHP
jgi:predicted nucleic acid-binding protein